MPHFTIPSNRNRDHLTVTTVPTTRPSKDGWMKVTVEIKAGGFSAFFGAEFQIGDTLRFKDDLARLYEQLSGTVQFQTMEGQLEIEVVGDGLGHFEVRGMATDSMSSGNYLHFSLDFDQSFVPKLLSELDDCEVWWRG